ncbi:hypothetical protein [Streptomyces sp. H27-S2]|uniref:hypothetical protein n=1 Tax=Streptomyces antarcticus TaxID=2996458 RepID=UPI0022712C3B|nr:hypothetical protein [Streptomyces sp. H27-S2]MCY0954463.1 hypothetical protein [Streptomyces sp. H27-S2]
MTTIAGGVNGHVDVRYRTRGIAWTGQWARAGCGRAWRGFDQALNRAVAIKEMLLPQGLRKASATPRSPGPGREAQAGAGLDHRGIVPVYDVVPVRLG